jgi:hypothetical protein
MALGWFNHLAGERAVAWSSGSEADADVNPAACIRECPIAERPPDRRRSAEHRGRARLDRGYGPVVGEVFNDPIAYEQAFLAELEKCLRGSGEQHHATRPDLVIEATLVGRHPQTEVVFVFSERQHPAVRYAFRWGRLWEWADEEDPEFLAHVAWANFEEAVLDFPEVTNHPRVP